MIKVSKVNKLVLKSEYNLTSFDAKAIESFKGAAIITVILTFYSLDYENMKLSLIKAKNNLCDFIHFLIHDYSLTKQDRDKDKDKDKPKWKFIIKSTKQKNSSLKTIIGTFIKNIYGLRNQYKRIQQQLTQLLDNISKLTIVQFANLINSSILFNYDNWDKKGDVVPQADLIPESPFIKTPSIKEHTLVLDMDETLTHNLIVLYSFTNIVAFWKLFHCQT